MLKVNELLDRTSKVVSSTAAISLGLAVITVTANVIKDNIKDLFSLRKVKAHIICVRKPSAEEEAPAKQPAKASTKKAAPSKKAEPAAEKAE